MQCTRPLCHCMENAPQPFIALGYVIECWTISSVLISLLVDWIHFKNTKIKKNSIFNRIHFVCYPADSLNRYTLDNKPLSDVTTKLFAIHETLGQVLTQVSSFVFPILNSISVSFYLSYLFFFWLQRIWIDDIVPNVIELLSNHNLRLFSGFGNPWE